MARLLYANNAQSTLAGAISNSGTTIVLQAGGGALFPNPGPNESFYSTLTDASTGLVREIVLCTARVGDTLTVVRAQQGTSGLPWSANDLFAQLWTAGDAQAMLQSGDSQGQTANFGLDIGVTNAYQVNLSPALTLPIAGMPIRVKIANTNTAPSTLNPGPGVAPITRSDGGPLSPGDLRLGMIAEFWWDGTANYQLHGVYQDAGIVEDYAGGIIPAGYSLADGTTLSRTAAARLFAAIGTTYGVGDGSTTFNKPDVRGRVKAGMDGAAGRLTVATMSPNGNTLGAVGGAQTESAGVSGSCSVSSTGGTSGSLSVSVFGSGNTGNNSGFVNVDAVGGAVAATDPHSHPVSLTSTGATSGALSVSVFGNGTISGSTAAVTNVQPTIVFNQMIKL